MRTRKEKRYEVEWVEHVKRVYRRFAESVFSVVRRFLGMRPYAVSLSGLIVKVYTSVIAYNFHRLWKMAMV